MALFCFILGQTKSGKSTLIRCLTPHLSKTLTYEAGRWARDLFVAQHGTLTAKMDTDPEVRATLSAMAVAALKENPRCSFEAFERFLRDTQSELGPDTVVFIAGVRSPDDFIWMTHALRDHTLCVLDIESGADASIAFDDGLSVIRQYIKWRTLHFQDMSYQTVSEDEVLALNKES